MVLWVWFVVLATVFVVGLVYLILTPVIVTYLAPITQDYIDQATALGVNTTQAQQTYTTILWVWSAWPLIIIFGVILWGFVMSQKKEPDQYYSGFG